MKKIIILFILLISACSSTEGNSVLIMSECKLPCWNGITPGVTTPEEAKLILEKTNSIGTDNVTSFYQLTVIDFSLYMEVPGLNKETLGLLESLNGKIVYVKLTENLNIIFKDITQQIGEPEFVISSPFIGRGNWFVLLYPSKGVSFNIWYDEKEVSPETKITSMILFNQADYEYLLDDRIFSALNQEETLKIMYQWEGYGSIEKLYPSKVP